MSGLQAQSSTRRVFLSHTAELRELPVSGSFVAAAERAVIRAGNAVVDMHYFSSTGRPPSQVCEAKVRDADVFVLILGFRYGSPLPDRPELSYCEFEYHIASQARIPVLVFLVSEHADGPATMFRDLKYGDRQELFRRRFAASTVTTSTVLSPGDLETQLLQSLYELDRNREPVTTSPAASPGSFRSETPDSRGVDSTRSGAEDPAREKSHQGKLRQRPKQQSTAVILIVIALAAAFLLAFLGRSLAGDTPAPATPSTGSAPSAISIEPTPESSSARTVDPVALVIMYFSYLPNAPDSAFALLGPEAQASAGGSRNYSEFYAQMQRVSISNVRREGPDAVVGTVTYERLDGSVTRDPYRFTITADRNGDLVIGSVGRE